MLESIPRTRQVLLDDLDSARPFIKWAGGKRHLISKIAEFLPPPGKYLRYYEPFLGSGAMFFHLRPELATLSDRINDLVITFRAIRDSVESVIEVLREHEVEHSKRGSNYYYEIRKQNPEELPAPKRAARFIYLNKTCYNGIYRVNDSGKFNVPVGRNNARKLDERVLRADNIALRKTKIKHLDYSSALRYVEKNDFVYLDPPYSGQFTSYHKNGFNIEQQEELSNLFRELHKNGAYLLMSNGPATAIEDLYQGFEVKHLESRVYLSGTPKGRKEVQELLIFNYNPKTGELLHVPKE